MSNNALEYGTQTAVAAKEKAGKIASVAQTNLGWAGQVGYSKASEAKSAALDWITAMTAGSS